MDTVEQGIGLWGNIEHKDWACRYYIHDDGAISPLQVHSGPQVPYYHRFGPITLDSTPFAGPFRTSEPGYKPAVLWLQERQTRYLVTFTP
jgi:hypothetical protein